MYKKGRWIALVVLFALALVACASPQMPAAVPTPALPVSDNSEPPIIQEPVLDEQPAEAQPPVVQPAEQPAAPAALHLAPSRIVIEAIGVDYHPVPVNSTGVVLDHDVAWYNQSAGPGEGENIVFWAHSRTRPIHQHHLLAFPTCRWGLLFSSMIRAAMNIGTKQLIRSRRRPTKWYTRSNKVGRW